MGILLTRLNNEEPSDALDRMEAQIKEIERQIKYKENMQMRVKKYSLILFLIIFLVFLIWYIATVPKLDWTDALLDALPLIVMPILFALLRVLTSKYYNWTLRKDKIKLFQKKAEKRDKLEEVKNTAVYAVAKNILDKYGGSEEDDPLITDV